MSSNFSRSRILEELIYGAKISFSLGLSSSPLSLSPFSPPSDSDPLMELMSSSMGAYQELFILNSSEHEPQSPFSVSECLLASEDRCTAQE